MIFHFGTKSECHLATCHPAITLVAREALAMGVMDVGVIHGWRGEKIQNLLYNAGDSKLPWDKSKHNRMINGKPYSWAIDILIYVNGKASWYRPYYLIMAGVFITCAKKLGIELRWGGNWDMDAEPLTDQKFQDLGHYELIREYELIVPPDIFIEK